MSGQSSSPYHVMPQVRAGKRLVADLSSDLAERIVQVDVDTDLHLADMAEITFYEPYPLDRTAVDEPALQPGCKLQIRAAATDGEHAATELFSGEITSLEAVCEEMTVHTVVRAHDTSHRLHRGRPTRTFLRMNDGEIARKVAREAGLEIGEIGSCKQVHEHVSQVAESDWEFLRRRARALGWETGVRRGKFYFRPSKGGARASSRADTVVELKFGVNLLSFRPRLSPASPARTVQVRAWNTASAEPLVASSDVPDPRRMPDGVPKAPFDRPAGTAPPVQRTAWDRVNVLTDASAAQHPIEQAKGLAHRLSATRAEAEGWMTGHPAVQAGSDVYLSKVPAAFAGEWRVTHAHHVFGGPDGYRTRFTLGGSEDRSLAGMATGGGPARPSLEGLVYAVVSDVNDPAKLGRVRLRLPWVADDYQSDWARVVQFGAGARGGALFLPGIDDEVLVGFELGDPGRPVVLGSLINRKSAGAGNALGGPAVHVTGKTARVVRHGFVSDTGNRLVFTDLEKGSEVSLANKEGNLALVIDDSRRTVTLRCDAAPAGPAGARRLAIQCIGGNVTVDAGGSGSVEVKTGPQGRVRVEGGEIDVAATHKLSLTSKGPVDIKGTLVQVSGSQIKLN